MSVETPGEGETSASADSIGASAEALVRELDRERRARQYAVAEGEKQRRFANLIDHLWSAMFASPTLQDLLREILAIFLDVVPAEVAVVRLREGDRLRSRAAVGLEEEVAAGFSLPVEEALPGPLLSSAPTDATCRSELIRKKGVRGLYCLPLRKGDELVGVVYLGTREERAFSDEERDLLGALTTRAAAVAARHGEHEALRQGIRSRDDVLAIVAHDLRNPLNVIALASGSLLQRLPDSAARRPVERIVRSALRAERLVQDLLEITAIEAGRFSIETRKLMTPETILAALESQQSLAADASIIIGTDLSPELPTIEADEERLLEVLENLIGNALKFTSPGGSVTVGARAESGEILFWVKDTGSGIPPEQVPHLFDRFWQGRTTDRRGSGLGLTICRAIVEAHGGRIWAESKVGTGTTFFFTVPAGARTPKVRSAKVANILLVDDRPENLLSLRAILERPEYRLVTASSGEEALSLALRETFAVALIDIAMPGMNGLEVAVHLKELERSRDTPIIFVTAFGDDPQEIHRAYSAGGADYLVKPLDPDIVRKKVAVFVDLSTRREAGGRPEHDGISNG